MTYSSYPLFHLQNLLQNHQLPKESSRTPGDAAESVTSDTPTIDSLIAITQADDPDLIAAQTNEQNAVLEEQQINRPLAAAQSKLDAQTEVEQQSSDSEDEELYGDTNKSESHKSTTPQPPSPSSPHKQSLLRDDDDGIISITKSSEKCLGKVLRWI